MVLKDKSAGIFQLKIDVGQHFNEAKGDLYIILREPTTEEALTLSTGETDNNKIFTLMPSLIIDHAFEEKPGTKSTSEAVWKLIMQRPLCATEIVEEWSTNIPLAKRKLKESEK